MTTLEHDIQKLQLMQGTKFLRAYLECSDEIQAGVRELLDILSDPETDEDDREATLFSIADALFPNPNEGQLGMDLEGSERMGAGISGEMRNVLQGLDREEETFAKRLRAVMEQRGVTQEALAGRLGVGQPAISNMLSRQCRPQRRTVMRIAEALETPPEQLWPGCDASAHEANGP
jgi:lambda repressor-like predicted transcriptional regulator